MTDSNDIILKKSNKNEATFKKIVIEGSKLIKEEDGNLSSGSEIGHYFSMALDFISKSTNMEKVLKRELLSPINIRKDFFKIFYSLKDYEEDDLIEKFLESLNETLDEQKNEEPKIFNFAFYTNIKVSEKNIEIWKDLLCDFNINYLEYSDLEIPKSSISDSLEVFETNNEILGVKIKSRSIYYAFDEAQKKLYVLFGFLTFCNKVNVDSRRYHVNEFALDQSLSSMKIVSYIIINNENSLEEDPDTAYLRLFSKIKVNDEKLKINSKIEPILEKYNEIISSDKKFKFKVNEMFELYYNASFESTLDSSFLKFWTFNERFLKEMLGEMKDKKLIKMMNNLLDGYGISRLNITKLKLLYRKRNSLVHEIRSDAIEENDRNFIKTIADKLLSFFLFHFRDVNNINEYGYILENYSISSNERGRKIELLELLEKLDSNKKGREK